MTEFRGGIQGAGRPSREGEGSGGALGGDSSPVGTALMESGAFAVGPADTFTAALPKLLAEVARETKTSAVASRIARAFVVALGAVNARVYLRNDDGHTLQLAAAENVDVPAGAGLDTVSLDAPIPAAVAARSGLFQLLDADSAPTFRPGDPDGGARGGAGVVIALPLFAGAVIVGAVSARFDDLRRKECSALLSLSDALGALIERAQLRGDVERLERSLRLRDEHTACAVHDLRQPLNVMLLSATQLAEHSGGAERRSLERLRTSGLLLDRMIEDLRDASFLASGEFSFHLEGVDVSGFVEAAVARHLPEARVSIEGSIPSIRIDPQRIEQVLANLLVNAVKYGQAGSAPLVEVTCCGAGVVISVTNDGDGIAEGERARIFDPYYRAQERRSAAPGLGLGLHICKRLVEGHGGRIWVENLPASIRFRFSLPLPGPTRES